MAQKNNAPDDFNGFVVEMFLDEDGDYLAHFVELPNVSAFGQTPAEALVELKAAWELMKECHREDGEPIPKADILAEPVGYGILNIGDYRRRCKGED